MDAKTFFDTVRLMRYNQLLFDKTRHPSYKSKARKYEESIDAEIERVKQCELKSISQTIF